MILVFAHFKKEEIEQISLKFEYSTGKCYLKETAIFQSSQKWNALMQEAVDAV
jgi:hypothetical protein